MTGAAAYRRRVAERVRAPDGRLVHPAARHGTAGGYSNYGCRCAPCTAAHSAALARARVARLAWRRWDARAGTWVTTADVPHGRASTYENWGCRCAPCVTAASAARWRRSGRRFGWETS